MIVLVVMDVLVGAGFGLFFPVFALVPSTFAAIGTAGLLGLSQDASIWWTAFAMILAGVGLQVGYLAGAICRVLSPTARGAIPSSGDSVEKHLRSSTRM